MGGDVLETYTQRCVPRREKSLHYPRARTRQSFRFLAGRARRQYVVDYATLSTTQLTGNTSRPLRDGVLHPFKGIVPHSNRDSSLTYE